MTTSEALTNRQTLYVIIAVLVLSFVIYFLKKRPAANDPTPEEMVIEQDSLYRNSLR